LGVLGGWRCFFRQKSFSDRKKNGVLADPEVQTAACGERGFGRKKVRKEHTSGEGPPTRTDCGLGRKRRSIHHGKGGKAS